MANLDPSVFEAVGNGNYKATGDRGISIAHMGAENAISHQNRCNILAERLLMDSADRVGTTSVQEGLGIAAAQRGDVVKHLADLQAAVVTMGQAIEALQAGKKD